MELHMTREEKAEVFHRALHESLEKLLTDGLVLESDGVYSLTEEGRIKAEIPYREILRGQRVFQKGIAPATVSTVTLMVHFILAAVKLPAAILSGSVGLLNDAVDTLLDGFSSLLVFFGFKFRREGLANILLVVFMLGTGGYTLFKAVERFFVPYTPEADVFTFAAAIISAVVCLLLWGYQRFAGLRNNSFTLVTQSVDSRNHVIVAVSVTAGLVASRLRWPLLDTLVGLAVASLILKSALELLVELVKAGKDGEVDLSRYKFTFFERLRKGHLCSWLLYLVERGEVATKDQLSAKAEEALGFDSPEIHVMADFGFPTPDKAFVLDCLESLFHDGRLEEAGGGILLTPAGKKYLHHRLR